MKHKTLGHSMIIIIFIHIECHVRDCVDYPSVLPLSQLNTQHRIAHDIQTNEWRPNCPIFFCRRKLCTMHRTCANPYTNSNSIDIDMKRKHRRKHNQSGPHICYAVLCLVCATMPMWTDIHIHVKITNRPAFRMRRTTTLCWLNFKCQHFFNFNFHASENCLSTHIHVTHTHRTQHTTQTPCHANSVCGPWTCGSVCVDTFNLIEPIDQTCVSCSLQSIEHMTRNGRSLQRHMTIGYASNGIKLFEVATAETKESLHLSAIRIVLITKQTKKTMISCELMVEGTGAVRK